MTKAFRPVVLGIALLASSAAWATPSTVFWTPATTYVQPFLVPHITYDTYFGDTAAYPIDVGLEMGFLPFEKLQGEIGLDAFLPWKSGFFADAAGPLLLNAKLGIPDGAFGSWFPGISAGVYGVGFTSGTQFDILHGEIGKTLFLGTITVGGYYGAGGDDRLWTPSDQTSAQRTGFLASYVTPDLAIDLKGLNKINFFADVQTGKNAFGGAGVGVGIYFTPAIDILTGPIFFFDKYAQPGQASMMWTVQLDIDIDLASAPPPPPAAPAAPAAAEPPKA